MKITLVTGLYTNLIDKHIESIISKLIDLEKYSVMEITDDGFEVFTDSLHCSSRQTSIINIQDLPFKDYLNHSPETLKYIERRFNNIIDYSNIKDINKQKFEYTCNTLLINGVPYSKTDKWIRKILNSLWYSVLTYKGILTISKDHLIIHYIENYLHPKIVKNLLDDLILLMFDTESHLILPTFNENVLSIIRQNQLQYSIKNIKLDCSIFNTDTGNIINLNNDGSISSYEDYVFDQILINSASLVSMKRNINLNVQ